MKKITLLFAWLLALTILFTGCGGNKESSGDTSYSGVVPITGAVTEEKICGLLIDSFKHQDFSYLYSFASNAYTQAISKEDFQDTFKEISAYAGDLLQISKITPTQQSGYDIYTCDLDFENLTMPFFFIFKDRKIEGAQIGKITHKDTARIMEIIPEVNEQRFRMDTGMPLNAAFVDTADSAKKTGVIFIGGSGPCDLDESMGANRIFADLAAQLAKQGIYSLRMDKRTYAYPQQCGEEKEFTIEKEYIDDVADALTYMQSHPKIDTSQIYLLGHSMGGQIAAEMAERFPGQIAGIILLHSSPRTINEIYYDQLVREDPGKQQQYLDEKNKIAALTKDSLNGEMIKGNADYYWYSTNQLNPVATIKKTGIKSLILNSIADLQSFPIDRETFAQQLAGQKKVTIKTYDKASHFLYELRAENTEQTVAALQKKQSVPEYIVTDIVSFIKQ